eukprot:gb/GFBE01047618.1/.p1 GENE.gb/GFBE01047618.1/~~gb/GFBE01047618.1/.p1  ORF type:complete len:308 (+),score=53.50 gb/GFBE01047618.1/:1-924(+)
MFYELLGAALSAGMCYSVQHIIVGRIAEQLAAEETQQSALAAQKLLTVTCDAEVILNKDLLIVGPSRRLVDLTMPGVATSGTGLEGMSFSRLVSDEDWPRVQDMMNRVSQLDRQEVLSAPASALHVNLKNHAGAQLSAELLHVAIPVTQSGEIQHLLGVKEMTDLAQGNLQEHAIRQAAAAVEAQNAQASALATGHGQEDARGSLAHAATSMQSAQTLAAPPGVAMHLRSRAPTHQSMRQYHMRSVQSSTASGQQPSGSFQRFQHFLKQNAKQSGMPSGAMARPPSPNLRSVASSRSRSSRHSALFE